MPKRDREGAGGPAGDGGTHADRPRYSKVDAETSSYFAEIASHFQTLEDDEERGLVADNALGEAAGQEPRVAADAACSRVLEALLPHASVPALAAFVAACCEGENLGATCTSGPFGSHVLEKALRELGQRAARADEEGYAAIEETLGKAAEAISDNLYDMAVHKYATHVARRLLSVLAGREVAPAPGRKQQQQHAAAAGAEGGEGGGGAAHAAGKGKPKGAAPGGLAAKLGTGAAGDAAAAGGGAGTAAHPEMLRGVLTTVLGDDWSEAVGELQRDTFGSPLLQAMLRAAACLGDDDVHHKLVLRVLGASSLDGLTVDALHALMKDRAGSHLIEVIFETAPDDLFQKLSTLAFKGHLADLARHPTANFAVQAGIAALRKPAQLKRVFEDLRPQLSALLRARRGGVVAAVAAAAGRLGVQEADVAGALWHALSAAGTAGAAGPLEALLTLDTNAKLGDGGRLSTLGCAMAAAVLRYPPAAAKQWADAVAVLPPGLLAAAARDSAGCRVLEAYLEGSGAAPKKRRALLRALGGAWANAAGHPAGGYFVEKCYALADASEKEAITSELAAAEQRLAATYWGLNLLRRCGVEAYKKGSDNWQQRVAAADAVRREFEDLFAEGAGGDGEGGGTAAAADEEEDEGEEGAAAASAAEEEQPSGGGKKKKKRKDAAAAAAAGASGDGGGKEKKKKRKAAAAADAAGEDVAAEGGKKMKKRNKAAVAAEAAADGAAAEGGGKKNKKKEKGSKDSAGAAAEGAAAAGGGGKMIKKRKREGAADA